MTHLSPPANIAPKLETNQWGFGFSAIIPTSEIPCIIPTLENLIKSNSALNVISKLFTQLSKEITILIIMQLLKFWIWLDSYPFDGDNPNDMNPLAAVWTTSTYSS